MSKDYTLEELQQLLRMAEEREAKKKVKAPRPVKVGSLVKYIDSIGREHTALVLELLPKSIVLKIFRLAQPNQIVEVGPNKWRR